MAGLKWFFHDSDRERSELSSPILTNASVRFSPSHIIHILDAAHINRIRQQAALTLQRTVSSCARAFIRFFDRGYLTITPEYKVKVEVSKRIKEEFNNAVEYYAMQRKANPSADS